jgi:hypothetical protein
MEKSRPADPTYGWRAYRSGSPRAGAFVLALGVAMALLAGCVPSGSSTVPPPTSSTLALLAVADGGRDSLSQIVQLGADPANQRLFILGGHQIFGPVTSAPWADHLVAVDRNTGARVWQFGTSATTIGDHAHQLSGIVVDASHGRVIFATSQQVLALRAADGNTAVAVALPSDVDCVGFPAPTQRPTLDAYGRVLFPCVRANAQGTAVGVLVDLSARTVTIVAPPPNQGIPGAMSGINGHVYIVADDGLRVFAGEPQANTPPIAELPFNVANLATGLLVETRSDSAPTGRLYLAGVGAQVAVLQDGIAGAPGSQSAPTLMGTVLAERAIALTVNPDRYRGTQTLPTLPDFLVAPGQYARTPCFGPTQPFSPNSVTTTTAATQSPDGTVQVDLRISVRDAHGSETGSRHWVVAVAQQGTGTATIQSDEGSVNPFMPTPPTPCPV